MKIVRTVALLFLTMTSFAARADTMVLVQGYLGDAGSWRASGITHMLQQNGWHDGGHMVVTPNGMMEWHVTIGEKDRFYTITLPTEAPIPVQASFLAPYVQRIAAKHKDDKITLVGHSAGGVVARTMMVTFPALKIAQLVTIASPNRGTGKAETGLDIANSPIGFFGPMFGAGTLNRSRGLYSDLIRERPGTFLNWLNTRKHPKARYVAVVRTSRGGYVGDDVVPGWSQEMRGIFGLKGHKVKTFAAPGPHGLSIVDGATILQIVGRRG